MNWYGTVVILSTGQTEEMISIMYVDFFGNNQALDLYQDLEGACSRVSGMLHNPQKYGITRRGKKVNIL